MLNDIVTRTRLKSKVQSFTSIKLKINFLKKTYTYVHTYNAAQFIYFSENVKRESFEQFLILKKKNPYSTIPHHHYRSNRPRYSTNQPLFPFFMRFMCVPPSSFLVPRTTYHRALSARVKGIFREEASQAGTRNAHRKRYPIRRPLCTFDVSRPEDGSSWKCIMDSVIYRNRQRF